MTQNGLHFIMSCTLVHMLQLQFQWHSCVAEHQSVCMQIRSRHSRTCELPLASHHVVPHGQLVYDYSRISYTTLCLLPTLMPLPHSHQAVQRVEAHHCRTP